MNRVGTLLALVSLLAAGCAGSSAPEGDHHAHNAGGEHHGDAAPPEPVRVLEDGSRVFGAQLGEGHSLTPLARITSAPEQFEGQVVQTSGEIVQVCQRMGCWMELRADAESPGVRVPMANHAFFLPRDIAGRRATIEGTVRLEALSDERREHLEAEGATAAGRDLSIDATGVVVH